jgi:hypothetical protein
MNSAVEDFWKWFAQVADQLTSESQHAIAGRFSRAYPNLFWELTFSTKSTIRTFAISADGRHELYPDVMQAVSEAPRISNFVVCAFKQRGSLDLSITLDDGVVLGSDSIRWSGQSVAACDRHMGPPWDTLELQFFLPGLPTDAELAASEVARAHHHASLLAFYLLLDNALGEWDAMTKIHRVSFAPLSSSPPGALPFRQLRAVIDGFSHPTAAELQTVGFTRPASRE